MAAEKERVKRYLRYGSADKSVLDFQLSVAKLRESRSDGKQYSAVIRGSALDFFHYRITSRRFGHSQGDKSFLGDIGISGKHISLWRGRARARIHATLPKKFHGKFHYFNT